MDELVKIELGRVVLNHKRDQQYIYLRVPGTEREFPIVIGFYEAAEIHRKLRGDKFERPMTHDLIGRLLTATDAHVDKVVVNALSEHTFYACLVVQQNGTEKIVDCRPSDAIALAVQLRSPIYVARDVLDEVCPNSTGESS